MGQAKRREGEIQLLRSSESRWYAELLTDQQVAADVAKAAFKKIVLDCDLTGACYHLAFFLREYLQLEKSIAVDMVVGWVTDSSWPGAISHAWIEHGGRKTDISLWLTEVPQAQISGAVLIHDFVYRRGKTEHDYWHDLPQANLQWLELQASSSHEFGQQHRHKLAEHLKILALSQAPSGADEYFSAAPAGMDYASFARLLA